MGLFIVRQPSANHQATHTPWNLSACFLQCAAWRCDETPSTSGKKEQKLSTRLNSLPGRGLFPFCGKSLLEPHAEKSARPHPFLSHADAAWLSLVLFFQSAVCSREPQVPARLTSPLLCRHREPESDTRCESRSCLCGLWLPTLVRSSKCSLAFAGLGAKMVMSRPRYPL